MTNKKKSNGIAPKFERSGRVRPHLFSISESSGTSTPLSPNLGLRKKTLTDIESEHEYDLNNVKVTLVRLLRVF